MTESQKRAEPSRSTHSHLGRRSKAATFWAAARWVLAMAACLWLALCTALGPLYRQFDWNPNGASIAHFSWNNAAVFALAFAIYASVVIVLARFAQGRLALPRKFAAWRRRLAAAMSAYRRTGRAEEPTVASASTESRSSVIANILHALGRVARRTPQLLSTAIMRATGSWWAIMLVLVVGWLWVPTTLVSAFGADLRNQFREFSWAWNQWTGIKQPYIGFFSFVPMDIYPTAHYLWPSNPTYLTDQHNIVLTIVYGAVAAASRYLTNSNDLGITALSSSQFLFAAFSLASLSNRFFNRPWRHEDKSRVGACPRFIIIAFLLLCPLVQFSTISLTKSPLFAFAFAWWFGINWEIMDRGRKGEDGQYRHTRAHTLVALVLSTSIMLISAKYAWYVVVFQFAIMLVANRKHWKTYSIGMLLPVIIIHGGLSLAISSGAIIGGDPIESHGVQLQQIARVAKLSPQSIPESAKAKIAPIVNLDQMAEAYYPQDADPAKSSGIQSKKVSYRWRTVTKDDMKQLNSAWLDIIKANPVVALDAALSEAYGYFDVTDPPYTDMAYYVSNPQLENESPTIASWCGSWRTNVVGAVEQLGSIPVIGWFFHGNFYVVLTLLVGAAEVLSRRWRTLSLHLPLLLLMGVMITSPANNFERHMLPLVFVFGFVALTFVLETREARTAARLEA